MLRVVMPTLPDLGNCLRIDEDRVRSVNRGTLHGNRTQPKQHQQGRQPNHDPRVVAPLVKHENTGQ